ncbi:tetratricopeptide repeat protein [Pseudoponticoccus marisrubri]|uniref:Uncharacterized protein n=1 Tax=Pseudoponticoccus marisrubri TaxID=1685382 RepID=A0A0W7WH10_9RHOB|nr:tetratricopeptide repeat protein [Pseudoponticoccus marisrubri]KUF09758.1 hypothetical protein AVJ23_16540 [Pseudoponticoccus marisrubri]
MTVWAKTIRAGVLACALTAPLGAAATGVSGDYLAARQASFLGDFEAAARYYGRALAHDPGKPELLERAIYANISLGKLNLAADLAGRLGQQGYASELGQMALISQDVRAQDYAGVLSAIEAQRGLGPLADGLVRAWALLGNGDRDAALEAFDEVGRMQGLAPFSSYHKALALASVGAFREAEAIFADAAAGSMTATRRGIMARAEILSQLDRNGDAVALIDTSFGADLDPGLAALREALDSGQQVPFTHAETARDGVAEVFYTLAAALSSERNDDLTLLYARLAEFLRPTHVDAILLSAEVLDEMGQFDLAVETYAAVPKAHPAYHAAELGRADALQAQDKLEQAVAVLAALAETHGELPIVHSTLGDLMRRMERYDDAVAAYTTALDQVAEITERQWFIFYARGISYERMDEWEQAEADFRRALELNPEQPQVLNYLGYSLVEKQIKLDEALNLIERAVAARPDSGYIVDSLGWVLYRLGRYEEAVAHMERAAELMPIDPIVNDHLGDVYWAVGRHREAEFMWRRALSFVDWEDAAEEADPDRIRRKIEVGLDQVLAEEGAPPLQMANDDTR